MAEQNSNPSKSTEDIADILRRIENNKDNPAMCRGLYQEAMRSRLHQFHQEIVRVQNAMISDLMISGGDCTE